MSIVMRSLMVKYCYSNNEIICGVKNINNIYENYRNRPSSRNLFFICRNALHLYIKADIFMRIKKKYIFVKHIR